VAKVLVDTGPLVALAAPNDPHHAACREQLRLLAPPLFTCWPVLTEAAWLLRNYPSSLAALLGNCVGGFLQILPLDAADVPPIRTLLDKYRDLSPQLADVALVHLARRHQISTIFTLDRRDFAVYRSIDDRPFELLPALA
jgi:uncharacterized protein